MNELLMISMMLAGFTPAEDPVFNVYCWKETVQDYVAVKVFKDFDKAVVYINGRDCKIEWINI